MWNKFATTRGLKTQKCFKNRLFGLKRIWDGIQPSNVVEANRELRTSTVLCGTVDED